VGDVHHLHPLDGTAQCPFHHAGKEALVAPIGCQCYYWHFHNQLQKYELFSTCTNFILSVHANFVFLLFVIVL